MRVGIIGDGAMGTVCSLILAGNGHDVRLWGHDAAVAAKHAAARENTTYLPGHGVPANVEFTADAGRAAEGAGFVVCAVPSQFIRPTLAKMAGVIPAGLAVVNVAKGIENSTLMRPTEIIVQVWGERPVAALSGPNIAGEIARKQPATMVVASRDAALAKCVQQAFTCPYVRVYFNYDPVGVELAGAMKNVVAIAAGILDGMKIGYNAKAALLSRGLVEISRLGVALGAQAETFAGLAGMGDLVTTCFSPEGRNRTFGERIGRGEKPADVLKSMVGVVEGVPTCKSVLALAARCGVEMPISEMLNAVLFEGKSPQEGIAGLMGREPKGE